MSFANKAHILFLAAVLCAGMARVSLLPPFEGMDETAHYSRILAAAFPPQNEKEGDRIAREVFDYYIAGPMSQGWVLNFTMHRGDPRAANGRGTLRDSGGIYSDYTEFFQDDSLVAAYKRSSTAPAARDFSSSPEENWQMQHPPFYYVLMGILCRALPDGITLRERFLALRTASFLLAFAGFAMGCMATRRHFIATGTGKADALAAFGAFYPFVMPAFFADVARLGNDSLLLFFFGAAWWFLLRHLRAPEDRIAMGGLGLTLGLALLTKATALAPVCGIFLYLALRHGMQRNRRALLHTAAAAGIAVAASLAWYVPYFMHYAFSNPGSAMTTFLMLAGDTSAITFSGIIFSTLTSLHGAVVHFFDWLTFTLPGIMSFIIALPVLWALAGYAAAEARKKNLLSDAMLPLWVFLPLLFMVVLYSIAQLVYGRGVMPAHCYYVHAVAPALAMCLGIGFTGIRDGRSIFAGRDIAAMLAAAGMAFTGMVFWLQTQMYAGCWRKENGALPLRGECFGDIDAVFTRLGMLSWPHAAAGFLLAAFVLAAGGLALILRNDAKKDGADAA